VKCKSCGNIMVRAENYDPEGVKSLNTVKDGKGDEWVCIQEDCKGR
jgi:hypothetical protein